MPGHGVIIPVDAGEAGGARGCIQRWKVSMMIMRPPQHGQGGCGSVSSTGAAASHAMTATHQRSYGRMVHVPESRTASDSPASRP